MSIKRKVLPKTPTKTAANADVPTAAKRPLTRVTETASAQNALVQSKPRPIEVAQDRVPSSSQALSGAITAAPQPPVVAKILVGPVESAVVKVFASDPDKEFTVNAVIAELTRSEPGINENSIRFTITELKRKSVIHHVRNDGHYQILKFTKPGEEKPFPKANRQEVALASMQMLGARGLASARGAGSKTAPEAVSFAAP